MSQSATANSNTGSAEAKSSANRRHVADSFSKSVLLLGCLLIMQRGIGFLRSFYVCGALSPSEVGQWDLAFNFLTIVAPLAVFGIPGSFGRYVARYEINGLQKRFFSHTLLACLALTTLACSLIYLLKDYIAQYFFGGTADANSMVILALGLPLVVFFNFCTSWFTGKRLNRVVFRIQFTQTVFFASLCVLLFQIVSVTAESVIIAYLLSCLVGLCLAASYAMLDRSSSQTEIETNSADENESLVIWRRILPFAIWVWVSNALMNLFSTCDRLLLVNFYPDAAIDVQFLVGQYHTACIFPLLLMTLGAMAGSMLIPYLSKDWESGQVQSVNDRMNLMIKGIGLLSITVSIGVLFVAPILFGGIWKDKFAMGESLLPMTLCYSSLGAMTFVAQKYFWCIEKTWLSSSVLLVGLITNFVLGVVFITPFGIEGVVASTLAAHAIVLTGVLTLCHRFGLKLDRGVWVIAVALLAICFGKVPAAMCFVALLIVTLTTQWLFTNSAKQAALTKVQSLYSSLLGNAS